MKRVDHKKVFVLTIIIVLTIISQNVLGLDRHTKLWLTMNAQRAIEPEKKWLTSIHSQLRFIDREHRFESAVVEPSIGYQFTDFVFWLGYRWSKRVGVRPYFQENRLYQQITFNSKNNDVTYTFRSRVEEIYRSNQTQLASRIRQRMAAELPCTIFENAYPYFYDEIFLPLNKTEYISRKFISENRLFVGFNYYQTKITWLEIGCILQYESPTPRNRQPQLSHILSISLNFK